jgi:hypothetical protein
MSESSQELFGPYGFAGSASGFICSCCLPSCSKLDLVSLALLIGFVTLMAGEGDGVASTLVVLGLLPQPAIGLSNKAVKTRSGKCLVDIDFGEVRSGFCCIVPDVMGDTAIGTEFADRPCACLGKLRR